MKKLGLLMMILISVAGMAFAQSGRAPGRGAAPGWGGPSGWSGEARGTRPESTTISGTIQMQLGHIVVVSGANTYFVPSLRRHVAFIQGLTEGAQVSLQGFLSENFLFPTSITIAGETHSLVPDAALGFARGRFHHANPCEQGGRRGPSARGGRRS